MWPVNLNLLDPVMERLERKLHEDDPLRVDVLTLITAVREMIPDLSRADAERAKLREAVMESLSLLDIQPPPKLGEFHWPLIAKKLRAALDSVGD